MFGGGDYLIGITKGYIVVRSEVATSLEGSKAKVTTEIIPPNTSYAKLLEARSRHFYVTSWDRANRKVRRTAGSFLRQLRAEAHRLGYTWEYSTTRTFQTDVREKKDADGNRPLYYFVSKRGKNGGRTLPQEVNKALRIASDFAYEQGGRSTDDCQTEFLKYMRQVNKDLEARGEKPIEYSEDTRTLYRRIDAAYNHENVERRDGRVAADRAFRGSTIGSSPEEPMALVVVDHTVIDVFVVDKRTGIVLGRPILSFAICVATRCIAGYIISFEPPSKARLFSLVRHIVSDKYYAREQIPDLPDEWETMGVPGVILIDRALENLSAGLREQCMSIGISIEWAPPHNGQFKAWGERLFGSFNSLLFHKLPGAVAHTPKVMRELQCNPAASATMQLEQLDDLILRQIIDYEHRSHRGLNGIPAEVFEEKSRTYPINMIPNISLVNELVGDTARVKLWRYGINFKGMKFQNAAATSAFLDAHQGEQQRQKKKTAHAGVIFVKIRFDPEDCSKIFVLGKINGVYECVEFKNTFTKYSSNLTFRMHQQIQKFIKVHNLRHQNEDDRLQARFLMAQRVDAYLRVGTAKEKRGAKHMLGERDLFNAAMEEHVLDAEFEKVSSKRVSKPPQKIPVTPPMALLDPTRFEPGAPPRNAAKAKKTRALNTKARQQLRIPSERLPTHSADDADDTILPSFLSRKER